MAIPPNPDVYLENVEKASVEDEVPEETGSTRGTGIHGGKQPTEILVRLKYARSEDGTYKRNADTQRLL